MTLTALVPGCIWHARQKIPFGPLTIHTRSTIVRLDDGSLWVHSPISPDPALMAAIAAIGPVRHVVAPNKSHHLFFAPFLAACPGAQGYLAPGLAEKRPDLIGNAVLDAGNLHRWNGELSGYLVEGIPMLNETVWFHHKTGTLIVTDLLFCFGDDNTGLGRLIARLLGVQGRMRMSRTMKLLVKDKAALRRTAETLLALDVKRVVLAHEQVVEKDANAEMRAAFAWLLD